MFDGIQLGKDTHATQSNHQTDKTISISVSSNKNRIFLFFLQFEKWYENVIMLSMKRGRGIRQHWHLFTVFNNCCPGRGAIWLKGCATLIVPFCGQSQREDWNPGLKPELRTKKRATVAAHRSYFMSFARTGFDCQQEDPPFHKFYYFLSVNFCVGWVQGVSLDFRVFRGRGTPHIEGVPVFPAIPMIMMYDCLDLATFSSLVSPHKNIYNIFSDFSPKGSALSHMSFFRQNFSPCH